VNFFFFFFFFFFFSFVVRPALGPLSSDLDCYGGADFEYNSSGPGLTVLAIWFFDDAAAEKPCCCLIYFILLFPFLGVFNKFQSGVKAVRFPSKCGAASFEGLF